MNYNNYNNYDDDDREDGRILTDAEYAAQAKVRPDVFCFEKANKMRNIQSACMVMAVLLCIFMSTRTAEAVASADFFDPITKEYQPKLTEAVKKPEEKNEEKKVVVETDKKPLKPAANRGQANKPVGGGDPRERVTKMGVLGIVSGQITGKSVASADIFGKGGFASDIDAILQGVGGLKAEGSGGVGRKGMAGLGHGDGPNSGFGGGGIPGGIDDLMNSLTGNSGGVNLTQRVGKLRDSGASGGFGVGGALSGGRSRISIQRVVMQNMAALRHAYSRRLRDKPGLSGTVTVKFSIDEFGKVIFAQMMSSSMNDPDLEATVVSRVKTWVFEKIDKPGDITEVTYPFAFSQ